MMLNAFRGDMDEVNRNMALPISLGKKACGQSVARDLAQLPQLLIAGAAGQGKTVFLHSFICSLIKKKSPNEVRFVLMDSHAAEFNVYARLPHLYAPIVHNAQEGCKTLKKLAEEMDRRFRMFIEAKCRDIVTFNEGNDKEKLPYLVVIVDELSDFMIQTHERFCALSSRIAALGRTAGIHLVMATSRPAQNIIPAELKANFPARLAFKVNCQVDSQAILDADGAESLDSRGDVLFRDNTGVIRLQAPYIDRKDVERIVAEVLNCNMENRRSMMKNTIALTLKEIADWQLTTRDKVSPGACWAELPSFQRGLVWSAAQIEVLWDSILRGIPIGAFSLLPKHGNEQYSKAGNATCNGGFFLLDGQQRANAIALGFQRFPCDDNLAESILWIDVLPYEDVKARSNRKHFFYVTTPARPWGYCIEDANGENRSGRVSVSQYRTALEEMGCDGAAIAKPTPARLWPVCAQLPVPVSVLRGLSDETRTAEGVLAAGGNAPWVGHFRKTLADLLSDGKVDGDKIDCSIKTICERLFATAEARVMAMIAPDSLSANPGDGERDGDLSEIALYFSRLNRGGTMPDREDLDYSILKSILPGLHAIDVCAANRMHPSRLAHIVMLAFLSTEAKSGWKRDLSRRDIMNLRDKSAFAKYVADGLPCDIERIDEWLMGGVSDSGYGIPKFLRTQIARQQPNLYRFLLMLAMKMRALSIDGAPAFGKLVTAFCTTLAWFGNDSALDFSSLSGKVDEIVAASSDPVEIRKTFGKWMAVQVEKEAMVSPPTLDYFRKIEAATLSGDMDAIRAAWSDPAQSGAANRIWYWNGTCGRGIVLYACRKYMGRTFGDYDPAAAVWSEDSCPWDYDHIVPQAWLKGTYHGKHHELVYEFLNSIGNIAPIPFGANRSKHDSPPGRSEFYAKCADSLFIDFAIDGRRPSFVDQYRIVEDDANDAFDFACMTSRRMVALYAEWWNTLEIGALLAECRSEDRKLQTEKIASCLRKVFPGKEGDIRFVYVAPDGRQLDVVNAWDWSRPWIACGIEGWWCKRDAHKKVRSFLCMTFQNGCVEYGVRRHPDETLLDGTGEWWINDQCHEAALSAPALTSDMEESFIGYAKSIISRSMDGAESAEWFEV